MNLALLLLASGLPFVDDRQPEPRPEPPRRLPGPALLRPPLEVGVPRPKADGLDADRIARAAAKRARKAARRLAGGAS